MLQYSELLFWWSISISWSAAFLIAVSIYLYYCRKNRPLGKITSRSRVVDFTFVGVLAGLLGLYIVSIEWPSSLLFALGNVVVEVILVGYTIKNRTK